MTMHIGQAIVSSLESVGQLFVIKPKLMKNRGL